MKMPAYVKGSALLALTLLAGFVLGVIYERQTASASDRPRVEAHDAMHHFTRELDLDPAQQAAIARILERRQKEVDSSWHTVRPHIRATMDSTMQEIARVLRPDQLEKYRRMTESRHPEAHR
jgi:hypothetical protein